MISVVITKHKENITSISFDGHAGYADEGYDIVCSAFSALVINTFNSIEKFTDQGFSLDMNQDGGFMVMNFTDDVMCHDCRLLVDSLMLGLDEIKQQYGDDYLSLHYKEV